MRTLRAPLLWSVGCCLALAACPAGDEKKADEKAEKTADAKADAKADQKADEADDAADEKLPELDLSGPTPPETNAVFFAVDGAMIPLACFDQGAGKLRSGKDCLRMVDAGQEVLLSSEYGRALDTVGAPKNALCEMGDTPTSLGTPALDSGQSYEWATWPKALGTKAEQTTGESKSDKATALSEDERAKLLEAVLSAKASAERGELRCNQKAALDVDGDGKKETFYSILMAHPNSPDRSLFSGLFMARGGDLGQLQLVESSKRDLDVLTIRGTVDLQGDGKRELWVGLTFDGGSGDRIVVLDGDSSAPLGKWTCGA